MAALQVLWADTPALVGRSVKPGGTNQFLIDTIPDEDLAFYTYLFGYRRGYTQFTQLRAQLQPCSREPEVG